MPTPQSYADPAIDLFFQWKEARYATTAASDALEGCTNGDERDALSTAEDTAVGRENAVIDQMMATQAQTSAGGLGKAIVLAHLAEQGGDPLVIQFIAEIQPDFERLLADLIGGAEPKTS